MPACAFVCRRVFFARRCYHFATGLDGTRENRAASQVPPFSSHSMFSGLSATRCYAQVRHLANFKTGALSHSATLPSLEFQSLSVATDRTQCERGPNLDPRVPENGFRPA